VCVGIVLVKGCSVGMSDLKTLEEEITYTFNNKKLLALALTHRSIRGEHNERLEFLGDAIINFLIADTLYQHYPDLREGELSCLRSDLVSGVRMADLARCLKLGDYLHLGAGERNSGGAERTSILADAIEALIGAIYLDSDIKRCSEVVLDWFVTHFQGLSDLKPYKDAKSSLQEWVQARKLPLPIYMATVSGEAHQQVFCVVCKLEGLSYETIGESSSRRKAEQIAAEAYLEIVKKLK
jgi:ribonuclease III